MCRDGVKKVKASRSPTRAWLARFWHRHDIDFGFALTLVVSVLLFVMSRLGKDSLWWRQACLALWTLYAAILFGFYFWRKQKSR